MLCVFLCYIQLGRTYVKKTKGLVASGQDSESAIPHYRPRPGFLYVVCNFLYYWSCLLRPHGTKCLEIQPQLELQLQKLIGYEGTRRYSEGLPESRPRNLLSCPRGIEGKG